MKRLLAGAIWCLLLAYPLIIYFGLQELSLQQIGLTVAFVAGLRLLSLRPGGTPILHYLLAVSLAAVALFTLLADRAEGLRYYPVAVNALLFAVFAASLWRGPSLVERMARLTEPELPPNAVAYTRKVTVVWCLFFMVNGLTSLYTALWGSLELWTLYNGLISYLFMAALFAVEWLVRCRVKGGHGNAGTG